MLSTDTYDRLDFWLSWICVYVIGRQVGNDSATDDPYAYTMQSLWRFLGQSSYLEITEGLDLELDDIDVKSLPYQHIENLGSGGSAIVEKVQDLNTGLVYARKTLRVVSHRDCKRVREQFHNEVKVMRRLGDHPHTTTLFATYTTRRDLALIVSPVADGGNLADFLAHRNWGNSASQLHHVAVLNRAFGCRCLASGLAFMHEQGVRHKDIKPQNILVHDGHVLYTDFGISREFLEAQSTTDDNPGPFTRRYCAPEVADWGDRNRSADIFSLGCVFLEILVALFPRIAPAGILDGAYHVSVQEGRLPAQLEYYNATFMIDSTFRHLISGMLKIPPNERPSALGVLRALWESQWRKNYRCNACTHRSNSHPGSQADEIEHRFKVKYMVDIILAHPRIWSSNSPLNMQASSLITHHPNRRRRHFAPPQEEITGQKSNYDIFQGTERPP